MNFVRFSRLVRRSTVVALISTMIFAGCSSSQPGAATAVPPAVKGRFTGVKSPSKAARKGVPSSTSAR